MPVITDGRAGETASAEKEEEMNEVVEVHGDKRGKEACSIDKIASR